MPRLARVRAQICWLLLVGGAAAVGCRGAEKPCGEPSQCDAGATSGGSGNLAGAGAETAVAGNGGTDSGVGGSGGAPGSSGGGTGGAIVLAPAGPGIACGETTCTEGSEMCCIGEGEHWCDEYQCSGAIARLECDDSADCPGERCCYTNISAMNWILTGCAGDCDLSDGLQVCKEAGDCENGDPCHVFVCGGLDTRNVAIGLCTATAPMNCE